MKKLKLDLDTLEVNSFETQSEKPAGKGTVLAHSSSVSYLTVYMPKLTDVGY